MITLMIHTGLCIFMTGLTWTMQIVHYPAFRYIDETRFCNFTRFHTRHISFIVAPMMLAELISGLYLAIISEATILYFAYINLGLLVTIWASTFILSVPCHKRLSVECDVSAISKLVSTNWIRTFLWTARSCLLCYAVLTLYRSHPL